MAYTKQTFTSGQVLKADHLNHMEDGIEANATALEDKINKSQGTANANKNVVTDANGNIATEAKPESLKNPYALTFTGAVNETYDGSAAKTINIPAGSSGSGSGITVDTSLSVEGAAADAKVTGDALRERANLTTLEGNTLKFWKKGIDGASDTLLYSVDVSSLVDATSREEKTSADTEVTLEPNKLYVFPEMTSLSISLATPTDTSIVNEYHFIFTSGATATTLSLPSTIAVDAYSIDANKIYEVSILENIAYVRGTANA